MLPGEGPSEEGPGPRSPVGGILNLEEIVLTSPLGRVIVSLQLKMPVGE